MRSNFKFLSCIILLLASSQLFANQGDSIKFKFEGKEIKLKYTLNREVDQAPFILENHTKKPVKIQLEGAYLVRGKHYDPLEKAKISLYYHNKMRKMDELTIPPGGKFNFNLVFKPFTIYTGSTYTVMCVLLVNGKKMEAYTPITMFKLEQEDKNKLKKPEPK